MSISGYANTVVTTQSISQSYFIKEIKKLTDSPYEFAKFKQNCNLIFSGPFVKKTENEVVKGAFYHLRNIAKIRKYIGAGTTEVLIHSFVSSRLDFCNSLLYGLPKYEVNKLQNVQNAAARVIAGLRKYDHISPTL